MDRMDLFKFQRMYHFIILSFLLSRRRAGGRNIKSNVETGNKNCESVTNHYGPELELKQISRHDSGVYLCIASNGVPPSVSKVRAPP